MDAQLQGVEADLKVKNDELKSVDGQIKALMSQPTNAEAKRSTELLREDVERLESRLKTLTEQKGQMISKKDKENMEKTLATAVKEWRKRKRMCVSVMDAILENYPKSKRSFIEDVGIETDEDVGKKIPDI